MVKFLISTAIWGVALIRRRRLLNDSVYSDLSVNGAVLTSVPALIRGNTVEISYEQNVNNIANEIDQRQKSYTLVCLLLIGGLSNTCFSKIATPQATSYFPVNALTYFTSIFHFCITSKRQKTPWGGKEMQHWRELD